MYVRAGHPAFARPCVGVHKSTSLMSSSLLWKWPHPGIEFRSPHLFPTMIIIIPLGPLKIKPSLAQDHMYETHIEN